MLSGVQTPIQNNLSTPTLQTQHKQCVHSLLLKEKIVLWVMPLPKNQAGMGKGVDDHPG